MKLFSAHFSTDALRPKPKLSIRLPSRCLLDASFHSLILPGAGIFNLLCIRLRLTASLSSRLTLGGRTWPRKPWVYGDQDSHLVYRYSCLHSH